MKKYIFGLTFCPITGHMPLCIKGTWSYLNEEDDGAHLALALVEVMDLLGENKAFLGVFGDLMKLFEVDGLSIYALLSSPGSLQHSCSQLPQN